MDNDGIADRLFYFSMVSGPIYLEIFFLVKESVLKIVFHRQRLLVLMEDDIQHILIVKAYPVAVVLDDVYKF
jgi:hypothetical protein